MQLIHNFGKKTIRKTVDAPGGGSLMLARGGSYLWTGIKPASRYQGWFFGYNGNKLMKIIDDVRIENDNPGTGIENNFWNIKKIGENSIQTFFLPAANCFAYEAGRPARIEFFLDVKEPYQNPDIGRNHEIWQEDGAILICYREGKSSGFPEVFIAVLGDITAAEIKEEWILRDYGFDRGRGSAPWERWVFKPAAITAAKLVFAVGFSKDEAINAARKNWRDFEKFKREAQKKYGNIKASASFLGLFPGGKPPIGEKEAAEFCAQNALETLYARIGAVVGLRAGLPWFFQFWQRDEAVSLKGLSQFDRKTALEIFWRQMGELKANDFHFDTADGIGWLFLRASDFYRSGKFNIKEIAAVRECLNNSIEYFLKNNARGNLAINLAGQKTWMDSLDRTGAAIEIQSLRLNMYALAADFADDKKQEEYYLSLESKLKRDVKKLFFDGKNFGDRFDTDKDKLDLTIRPNIFLAAYIYPGLLSKKEWSVCFAVALEKLWLDWGGLSTIDKNDPRFCGRDTGENPAAYHNGDSWFWINNIAAIAMARVDKKKFKNHIEKIFEASKNDILWNGAIGCAGEISSAAIYESAGCPNQAWSNATFLELYRYVSGKF
ncbi:MAG: hypothetical protein L7H18_01310 [Candidatus Nealsonbacteria bacterium DGGOD1a]|nr:MAG: hypothetical protein L7H18_01310 [Candidatus Nealsonbacteria bacterium DGGOD1a]